MNLVQLAADLVSIPSVNPMGRPLTGPEYLEHGMTNYLESFVRQLGLNFFRQSIEPGRDNLVALIPGERSIAEGGRMLMLEAHQDTVPVDGMTIPPWTPTVKDGRLYGRGSCDIKGGMAAILATAARLVTQPTTGRPNIVLAFTVNEEYGFSGAKGLVKIWDEIRPSVCPRPPDGVIVSEPTNLQIVVAHRGVVRWKIRTRGRAAHSSLPDLGDNAIYRMGPILLALRRYQKDIVPTLGLHPLCGGPTISAGRIHGGISVNTVPDECVLEIDRRVLPGDDPMTAYQSVVDWITAQAFDPSHVEHEPPFMISHGLSNQINGQLAEHLSKVIENVRGEKPKSIGVSYGTDAAAFGHQIPSVVFGPGSIDQAHTADEWVSIEELNIASEILFQMAMGYGC